MRVYKVLNMRAPMDPCSRKHLRFSHCTVSEVAVEVAHVPNLVAILITAPSRLLKIPKYLTYAQHYLVYLAIPFKRFIETTFIQRSALNALHLISKTDRQQCVNFLGEILLLCVELFSIIHSSIQELRQSNLLSRSVNLQQHFSLRHASPVTTDNLIHLNPRE